MRKPVVFMGETLTCPPGFLGGRAPVVSLSRYKFQAARHRLCGDCIAITEEFSIIKVTIEENLQLLLNPFYACTLTLSSRHLDVNTLFNCSLKMILQRSQFFTLAWRGRDTAAGRLPKN